MRHAGHEPAPGGSRAGRGSRSPWGHADGPGRMAPHQGPRRARQPHAGAAAGPIARIEPGREHLAFSARQLVVEPRVRLLPRHRRSLLRRVEPPHRPALDHHVHRPPGLGQCMRISAGWYYYLFFIVVVVLILGLHTATFRSVSHLTKNVHREEAQPGFLGGVEALRERLPRIGEPFESLCPRRQDIGTFTQKLDRTKLTLATGPCYQVCQALVACHRPSTDRLLDRWPVFCLLRGQLQGKLDELNAPIRKRLESLWVTFPAACGVSPSHDQRRRQEAGLGLPEATREPPIGSLLKYPAACGGDPLSRVQTVEVSAAHGPHPDPNRAGVTKLAHRASHPGLVVRRPRPGFPGLLPLRTCSTLLIPLRSGACGTSPDVCC